MDSDRYLNSSRVIRELAEAEEQHQLDHQGVLDELSRACAHCDKKGAYHQGQADAYMLARAAYFAEAKRRTTLSSAEVMLRYHARKEGRPDPVAKEGFPEFCQRIGAGVSTARNLARIAEAPDPLKKLNEMRAYHREKHQEKARKRQRVAGRVGLITVRDKLDDPLSRIKTEWGLLSFQQRLDFLTWVKHNFKTSLPLHRAGEEGPRAAL